MPSSSENPIYINEDLLTRTSWVNAEVAYYQLEKGKIDGNKYALLLRCHIQRALFKLGCFIQLHAGKVVFVGLLLLCACCIGLKHQVTEKRLVNLWVEEGGRVAEEQEYTRQEGNVSANSVGKHVVLIHTSRQGDLLTPEFLLDHVYMLNKLTKMNVTYTDPETKAQSNWTFRDVCNRIDLNTENVLSYMQEAFKHLLPCLIITPLDCFWEGAKVVDHGQNKYDVFGDEQKDRLLWVSTNPQNIPFTGKVIKEGMKRAGVTTGYLKKPCLDPRDKGCPKQAPNKKSKKKPNVALELTGGCRGMAERYLIWPEELIVGVTARNASTGTIISAGGLQSVLLLADLSDFVKRFDKMYKIESITNWSTDVARKIFELWQTAFIDEVQRSKKNPLTQSEFDSYTELATRSVIEEYTKATPVRLSLGYILMLLYAILTLLNWKTPVDSQCTVGMCGVVLVALSVAAGLGLCSAFRIRVNAASVQILPFLALGLGVDDMFIIAHTYAENFANHRIKLEHMTGHCLREVGVSVFITSAANMLAFFTSTRIPIPALRAFSLQAGILVLMNFLSIMLIFPAIISIDLRRRQANRFDVLCCITGIDNNVERIQSKGSHCGEHTHNPPSSMATHTHTTDSQNVTKAPSPPRRSTVVKGETKKRTKSSNRNQNAIADKPQYDTVTRLSPKDLVVTELVDPVWPVSNTNRNNPNALETPRLKDEALFCDSTHFNITFFVEHYYSHLLQKTFFKVLVIIFFLGLTGLSVWGSMHVRDGLDLKDMIPYTSPVYDYLEKREKFFSFYLVHATTKGKFDYANKQPLLREYFEALSKIKYVIKPAKDGSSKFWLNAFRDWLIEIQQQFHKDWRDGKINVDGWGHKNKSWAPAFKSKLVYKLLAQTGSKVKPLVDRSQVTGTGRLVDKKGIINPRMFYYYLSYWYHHDYVSYVVAAPNFHPIPPPHKSGEEAEEKEIVVKEASKLVYTEIPFYISGVSNMTSMMSFLTDFRKVCDNYTLAGLPNYPDGHPFMFWEQYVYLRRYLLESLGVIASVICIVIFALMVNMWIAVIAVLVIISILLNLFGFMGFTGIKMSAIPATILIVTVGIGVEFTVHICMGFMTSVGSRNRRMALSMNHMTSPVTHGAISTFLGIVLLASSEFDFIVKYFFLIYTVLIGFGLLNGLILLPVILSLIGPRAEVRPKDGGDRIPIPSLTSFYERRKNTNQNAHPLSTITEETTQISSVVVEPEVIIETSSQTCSPSCHSQFSKNDHPCGSQVTRVKAKTTVKVEVISHLPGSVCETFVTTCTHPQHSEGYAAEHCYKSLRRSSCDLPRSYDNLASTFV